MKNITLQLAEFNNPNYGRFGNKLFKFLFLKWIEKKMDFSINVDKWEGNLFFNLKEENPTRETFTKFISDQKYSIEYSPQETLTDLLNKVESDNVVIDVYGFFQFHTSHYFAEKDFILNLFKFSDVAAQFLDYIYTILGNNFTTLHIRRGDYLLYNNHPLFWTLELREIIKHLLDRGIINNNDILYVATDDIDYCEHEFNKFNIKFITNRNFPLIKIQIEKILIDFIMMANAKKLVISNSSLSFFASMINTKGNLFLRPSSDGFNLREYNPWNDNVLLVKI